MVQNFDRGNINEFDEFFNVFPIKIFHSAAYCISHCKILCECDFTRDSKFYLLNFPPCPFVNIFPYQSICAIKYVAIDMYVITWLQVNHKPTCSYITN